MKRDRCEAANLCFIVQGSKFSVVQAMKRDLRSSESLLHRVICEAANSIALHKMENIHQIKEVVLGKYSIPLKKPFITSLGPCHEAENVIVFLTTASGITGTGECSPFMTINGETAETCMLVGTLLAKVVKGQNAANIESIHQKLDAAIYGNSSIKSAFDMALYDIASQHASLPLYKFIGGINKSLTTDYTVSLDTAEKMADAAAEIKAYGFKVIKVKLGGTAEGDIERIMAIRERIGLEIPIRIDANQGWNEATAIYILKQLQQFNIQFCEEPLPRWDFMRLSNVSHSSTIPVMADESCFDEHDAERLINLNACNMFNIKTGKSGIYKSLKIIRLAEKANIYMQVGGFLESRLGFTAAAHLALSSGKIIFYDFDTPLMFAEDPVTGGIIYNNGEVSVPETPGIGASIKHSFLRGLITI